MPEIRYPIHNPISELVIAIIISPGYHYVLGYFIKVDKIILNPINERTEPKIKINYEAYT